MSETPFRATPRSTLRLTAATAAGGSPRLEGLAVGGGCSVRIRNRGTGDVAVEFGARPDVQAVPPTATVLGSQTFGPGAVEFQSIQDEQRFVSVALASSTGTVDVEFTCGQGD